MQALFSGQVQALHYPDIVINPSYVSRGRVF